MAGRLRLPGLRERERGPAQAETLRPPVPRLQEADLGGGRDVHAPLARAIEELASGSPHHDFAFERDVGLAAPEPSGPYQQDTLNSAFRVLQFCADDSSGRACHGKAAAAVRRRHRGLVSGGVRRGGPHARLPGAGPMRSRGLAQREGGVLPGLGAPGASGPGGGSGRAASGSAPGASLRSRFRILGSRRRSAISGRSGSSLRPARRTSGPGGR